MSLNQAQLQGVSLESGQLQGAFLLQAQLQGASLRGTQLQGAFLLHAQLQGASLYCAQVQGALLSKAQLQGASLDSAATNATDFSEAFLWRTKWGKIDGAKPGAIRLKDATWEPVWQPVDSSTEAAPWSAEAYAELRASMKSISAGEMRFGALKEIERLDCTNQDQTLASCDPAAKPPSEVSELQKQLLQADVDYAAFAKALATELRSLVCANYTSAIDILRGMTVSNRLADTGPEAPALVDFIMSKDCPVSAALTGDDKAKLLQIKQDAQKNVPPLPAPNKEQ